MSIIKTALTAGERISSVVGVPWGGRSRLPEADALLLHAYAVHEASMCPCGCGFPAEESLDPMLLDGMVEIDVETRCAVRAALDEWREGDGKEVEPGVIPRPVIDQRALAVARARSGRLAGPEGADQPHEQ